jgi:hypothetical protein
MKLRLGDFVSIESSAGKYRAKVVNINRAQASDGKEYDNYQFYCLSTHTDRDEPLQQYVSFNENMADKLIKEITAVGVYS